MAQPFYPNLVGRVDPVVERAIRDLYVKVNGMGTAATAVTNASTALASAGAVGGVGGGGGGGGSITGPLGPTGSAPFPQTPRFPILTSIPAAGSPYNIAGTAVLINGIPYAYINSTWVAFQSVSLILVGTHAQRLTSFPASSYQPGTLFYETDRTVYYLVVGTAWVYTSGVMRGTLSPSTQPTDLAAADVGFLFFSTDFFHTYAWDIGLAWEFENSDTSGQIVGGNGAPPNGGLWQLCDGSTVTVAQNDGSVVSVTTPTVTGLGISWYLRR